MSSVRITKQVGTLPVSINIHNDSDSLSITGEVFPFAHRFHCADFHVSSEFNDNNVMEASVSCGGNRFNLAESTRMIEAAKVAHDQASYYENLANTLIKQDRYRDVMNGILMSGQIEAITDALLLTPYSQSLDNIEYTIKRLQEDPSLLYLAEGKDLLNHCHELPYSLRKGLSTLFSRHPRYDSETLKLVLL